MLGVFQSACPLCGFDHPVRFLDFVPRSYRREEASVSIKVPRLLCEPNRQRRRQTGEPLQYSLRILPGFLIPHSRLLVDGVQGALESFIAEPQTSRVGATLRMGCLSPLSFLLFFRRVEQRLTGWLQLLVILVGELGGEVCEQIATGSSCDPLAEQWRWLHRLLAETLRLYARLPQTQPVPEALRWQYLYALLSRRQMGLGP